MIVRRKLFAKPTIDVGDSKEGIYFRDSFYWKNFPGKEAEEDRILKLLKDLDKKGYLNQHGKDYLSTVNHREEIHISSYMLTDEGEDVMERYGDLLENGSKSSISLNQINQIKSKPMNLKEREEAELKSNQREAERLEKEEKELENALQNIQKNKPEVGKLNNAISELRKNQEYQWLACIDDIPLPLLEDFSWSRENNNRFIGIVKVGDLFIYYDTNTNRFVEEVSRNRTGITTKPVNNLKQRLSQYLEKNKSWLLDNAYSGISLYDGREISKKDKAYVSTFVEKEIKAIQKI